LGVDVSSNELIETNTYDVASIRVVASDENKNILPYFQESMILETEGPIEVIGPKVVPFRGGMAGIYVKSCFEEGDAVLRIHCESMESVEIKFHVSVMPK
jgi:beta-galactosidase